MLTDIKVLGARVHNLKNISVTLPRNALIVFTGLSGSGKSSLAFDTIFAEGQRRYMESLSSYARQFLDKMDKPDVDAIEGLSPAISIDQKTASHNPRSTVGTVTEIYDYLRLLFASIGHPHCPKCKNPIQRQSVQEIMDAILTHMRDQQVTIMAPVIRGKKGEHRGVLETAQKDGFVRVRVNGTLYRLDEDWPTLEKTKKHDIDIVVDRITVSEAESPRLFESLETALRAADGLVSVVAGDTTTVFSEHLACSACQFSIPEMSPRLFSFNAPAGACPECKGLGDKLDFDPDLVIEFPEKSLRACTGKVINIDNTYYGQACAKTGKLMGFTLDTKYEALTEAQRNIFLYGVPDAVEDNPFMKSSEVRGTRQYGGWEGLLTNLRRRYVNTPSEGMRLFFQSYMSAKPCHVCQGARLRPEAIAVTIGGLGIHDLCQQSIGDLLVWMQALALTDKEREIVGRVHREIISRVGFLTHVGLHYLTLSRKSNGLSGGEFQRIRLATQIGAGLTGVLYVLDEPSIGLHQRDNHRLIEALIRLRDIGNTLIVVEHDEDMVRIADHVVDIGPRAGRHGGHVVFSGSVDDLLKCETSMTGDYLSGRKRIEVPAKRREVSESRMLTIHGARENNLQNITVNFPLGCLVGVTGVSGSGKSTLITDILQPALMRHFYKSKERPGLHDRITGFDHLDKVILIDQSPIGRTPRSNPATYTGLFTPLRELFATTREAKIRGYGPGRFSFNVKGGRCESCQGDGLVKIEMHFLSDVFVTCEVCKGKRYNTQTLEVKYKGYNISDVLNMTVDDASDLFAAVPSIRSKLVTLQDVGLGYVQLGQNATTLSGGEAQRIKLAKELSKRSTGKTVYLLDEPTTGLHFADIAHLLEVLNRLVDAGNTVIVIEHNLDVIKVADYLIDLGPEGGSGGGQVVAMGSPEVVAATAGSHTGMFLKGLLEWGGVK
jgi:excinuclease ABC subunit A